MGLEGKVAVVTGGNSGIGKAVVLALAGQGANLVIDYVVDPNATEDLENQVSALGDRVIGVNADVSQVADLQRLIDRTITEFGRLDIMVNNAGVETRTSVLDTTEAQYDRVMAINLKSAFFGTQIAARQMIQQGGGCSTAQQASNSASTGSWRSESAPEQWRLPSTPQPWPTRRR